MNKLKLPEHKKLLVRNTSRTVSKTSVASDKSKDSVKKTAKSSKFDKKSLASTLQSVGAIEAKTLESFETPELNSALQIAKKIETVENLRLGKPKSDFAVESSSKLCLDDKVTRLVNFPYDQHVFRDLIPITDVKEEPSPPVTSRPPLPHRDREPVLSDYCKPRKCKEYYYQPKYRRDKEHVGPVEVNNLRLYKILQLAHDN